MYIPTQEQVNIVSAFQNGKSMKVRATAGSGKTSTLVLCANSTNDQKLYIAFNKAIAVSAASVFPENTKCSTGHALGYRPMSLVYGRGEKLTGSLRALDIAKLLNLKALTQVGANEFLADSTLGYLINETVKKFLQSADETILAKHVVHYPKLDLLSAAETGDFNLRLVTAANKVWDAMRSKDTKAPLGFDGYLKQWALTDPVIDQPVILMDEAQDLNGAMFSILQQQMGQIVYVGDPHQQIYSWRGAVNAMEKLDHPEYVLSKSFRFGADIAKFATQCLLTIDPNVPTIHGHDPVPSTLVKHMHEPCTYLFRKNASMLDYILTCKNLKNVFVQGGVTDLVRLLEALEKLDKGRKVTHPELLGFNSLNEVREYAEKAHANELKRMLNIYDNNNLNDLIRMLDTISSAYCPGQTVLSTAHKSKGCEWDNVVLWDDFKEQPEEGSSGSNYNKEETRLTYVAATRAKLNLKVPFWMQGQYGEGLIVKEHAVVKPVVPTQPFADVPF